MAGAASTKTREWEARRIRETGFASPAVKPGQTAVPASDGIREADQDDIAKEAAKEPGTIEAQVTSSTEEAIIGARPDGGPTSWQVVATFRRKQAMEDWRTADAIRAHMKAILRKSLVRERTEGGEERVTTGLKPHEVKQIAQTAAELQRIQRLALGLSTENLGIDPPSEAGSHVEKNVTPTPEEEPIPTFVVEMSVGGKFMRPRPRRVR